MPYYLLSARKKGWLRQDDSRKISILEEFRWEIWLEKADELANIENFIQLYLVDRNNFSQVLVESADRFHVLLIQSKLKDFHIFQELLFDDTLEKKMKNIQVDYRRPIHLYLIFEKSSWKNQVRRTGFSLPVYPAKNQFWNWFLQVKNPFRRT